LLNGTIRSWDPDISPCVTVSRVRAPSALASTTDLSGDTSGRKALNHRPITDAIARSPIRDFLATALSPG